MTASTDYTAQEIIVVAGAKVLEDKKNSLCRDWPAHGRLPVGHSYPCSGTDPGL